MIEGIKMDVMGSELSRHCKLRAERYAMRVKAYEAEISKHAPIDPEDKDVTLHMYSNKVVSDARDQLLSAVKNARAKAEKFNFMAEHFGEREVYRLSTSDITELEIATG